MSQTDAADDMPSSDVPACTPPWLAEPFNPTPRARFPSGFLWGSATAPYQIEGGLGNTDWGQWERMGRIVNGERADDGPQSLAHYTDDIRTLTETRQNAYRFGIEWARLFPTREAWLACRRAWAPCGSDPPTSACIDGCRGVASSTGVMYYHQVLDALRGAGITSLVTLQHFTLPDYINDLSMDYTTQGWMRAGIVDDLRVWAGFVAAEYGSKVDWWVTLNEPVGVAAVGYLDGRHPPGRRLDIDAVVRVVNNMIDAHVAMYDAIHAADTTLAHSTGPIAPARPAMVSIAHHARRFYGNNCRDRRDAEAAARIDQIFNRLFWDAIVRGNVDRDASGTIDAGEPMNDPAYRGRADWVGINYYTLTTVTQSAVIPVVRGIPQPDEIDRGLPKTDLGWDIYPRGFQDILMWAGSYGLPVVVTENGIADATDTNRARYLTEHLAAVAAAIQSGVNIVGYFHWSTIDNFEWTSGYCPRFGLYSVDYGSPARTRTARASAMVYRQIIEAGEVSDALLTAQQAQMYRTPASFCATMPMPGDGGM